MARVVFDQSSFVKAAIHAVVFAAAIGLFLTCVLILVFLASLRATVAVFLSVPLSILATSIPLYFGGSSVNTMILGGMALAFSRLIYNAVVVLENIFRHLEKGESSKEAAEKGGKEVALPVLAATLATAVVFFPVTFLYGVSRFLFSALALAVVLALIASYVVAMTIVPLFCAKLIGPLPRRTDETGGAGEAPPLLAKTPPRKSFSHRFNQIFNRSLDRYEKLLRKALNKPVPVVAAVMGIFILSLGLYPWLGVAFFPRTDAGQFVINLKAPSGTRIEGTDQLVKRVESLVRDVVSPRDHSGEPDCRTRHWKLRLHGPAEASLGA